MTRWLADLVTESARRDPERLAVSAPDGELTYGALDRLANQIGRELRALGVDKGDRVALWMNKSTRTIAAMQAVLRLGAAYVPIDPTSPRARAGKIVSDCAPRVLITDGDHEGDFGVPCLDWQRALTQSVEAIARPALTCDDLAYILYTSGSTGQPKGVCISHENALACIDWATAELGATAEDRFSNHAPFHFDISVLDLYPAFAAGASVHLVPERSAYLPAELARFLVDRRITIWYSVPSALLLMLEHGGLESLAPGLDHLRVISFAGEPFPVPGLRRLRATFPAARLLNLYGPTETNVCTFFEVGEVPERVPIGRACSGDRVWAVDQNGNEVPVGGEGELLVEGPTVMSGYFGQPARAAGPYRTGDLVRRVSELEYEYIGRLDHMVKVRGHRVELGDIESTLLEHPIVRECAVMVCGTGIEARLIAFLSCREGAWPGLLAFKQFCAERLPRYMIIDKAIQLDALPRTGNGKIDRKHLLNAG